MRAWLFTQFVSVVEGVMLPMEARWIRHVHVQYLGKGSICFDSMAIEVFKALQGISPPYIQDLFREKDVPYNLRAHKIVIQPKC